MPSRGVSLLSLCPSVTFVYSIETNNRVYNFFHCRVATSVCRVRQHKISQRENRDIYIMQEYFYTKFSTFIYHICLHKSLSRSELYQRYFTHNQSYRPNCDYYLKYWRIYYNAMLHVNIKIMTSQQRSNTLVCSIVINKWAKFGAKIFRHFWDIAIFVLGYFILPHLVEADRDRPKVVFYLRP